MNYGLENSNSNSIEQTSEVSENVSDNNLVETKEISEDFDDCGVEKVLEVDHFQKEFAEKYNVDMESYEDCEVNDSINDFGLDEMENTESDKYEDCSIEDTNNNLDEVKDFDASVADIKDENSEDIDFGEELSEEHVELKENGESNMESDRDVLESNSEKKLDICEEDTKGVEKTEEKPSETFESEKSLDENRENLDELPVEGQESLEEETKESQEELDESEENLLQEDRRFMKEETKESEKEEDVVEELMEEDSETLEEKKEKLEGNQEKIEETVEEGHVIIEEQVKELEEDFEEKSEKSEKSQEKIEEMVEEGQKTIEEQTEKLESSLTESEELLGELQERNNEFVEEEIGLVEENGETIEESSEEDVETLEEKNKEMEEKNEELEEKREKLEENKEEFEVTVETNGGDSELETVLKNRDENADILEELRREKETLSKSASEQFEKVVETERGSEEYKQSLKDYNVIRNLQTETETEIAETEKIQEELDRQIIELREAQIQKGEIAVKASTASIAWSSELQDRFEEQYYSDKPDKKELSILMEENKATISEMASERNNVKLAMEAKMSEIRDYVFTNELERYDTERNPQYQRLIQEYRELEETYHSLDYNVIKLDENNIEISEFMGEGYESVRYQTGTKVKEIADDTDIPGHTEYFVNEVKTREVLSSFKQGNWENISIKEKKRAVEQLADFNAEILGVENPPTIVYYKSNELTDFGGFSSSQHTIYINESNMADAIETADTISHEYRHCYQRERAEILETERDLEFKEGFDNYISPEDDYAGYRNQQVERDARDYAKEITVRIASMDDIESGIVAESNSIEGDRPAFETLNLEKGEVFDEVGYEELPQDFKKKIVEVKEYREVFEERELQEIKGKISLTYENGVKIAERIEEFNTYKEHHEIDGGHIGKVHDKSLQAADVMERAFEKSPYRDLYSSEIDRKSLEMMAFYHDTGMDGNIDIGNFDKAKQQFRENMKRRETYVAEKLSKGEFVEEANKEFDEKVFESQFRKEHSVQSAIHVLRDRDFIESKGVDANRVALGCLAHSKSNSGITNLADEVQWQGALDRLMSAVKGFNVDHPDEQIVFDDSFLKNEDGSFDKESLAELRSESLCLRIGDANGHDSQSHISQNGKKIKFSLDDWKCVRDNLSKDLRSKIEAGDCNKFIVEVQNANVAVDDIQIDDGNDPTGFTRMFTVGEGNFRYVNLEMVNGMPTQKFNLENGDAYPMSTQFCILERLKEYNTAKLVPQVEVEKPIGMSDDALKKYKEAQMDSMQKIDFVAEISIGNADDITRVSYEAFADKVKDQYNIDVIIKSENGFEGTSLEYGSDKA